MSVCSSIHLSVCLSVTISAIKRVSYTLRFYLCFLNYNGIMSINYKAIVERNKLSYLTENTVIRQLKSDNDITTSPLLKQMFLSHFNCCSLVLS